MNREVTPSCGPVVSMGRWWLYGRRAGIQRKLPTLESGWERMASEQPGRFTFDRCECFDLRRGRLISRLAAEFRAHPGASRNCCSTHNY